MTLSPGGVVEFGIPGPDDRGQRKTGTWSLEGDVLTVVTQGRSDVLKLETLNESILVVRRTRGEA